MALSSRLSTGSRESGGLWNGGSNFGARGARGVAAGESWDAGDFVAALGRVEPRAEVSVEYGAQVYRRVASELGVWGFVHAADSPRLGELPGLRGGFCLS